MNAVAQIKPATDIVALVQATPVLVLTDKQKFSDFYEAMKAECDALKIDLETEKGRKAIASMAYKVARTKTAIDDAGKLLNEESRARINAVDESRREIRNQLDALKDEVRKPLTDWEQAEEARQKQVDEVTAWLRGSAKVEFDETAADIRARIAVIAATQFPADVFQGYAVQGEALKAVALSSLEAIADRMDQEELQRAELEKLREQAAKREAEDMARREAEEFQRQKEAADKLAVEAKARAEADQKAREEAAAKAAAQRARDEAEAKARAKSAKLLSAPTPRRWQPRSVALTKPKPPLRRKPPVSPAKLPTKPRVKLTAHTAATLCAPRRLRLWTRAVSTNPSPN